MRKINKRSETAIYILAYRKFLGLTAERTAVILRSAPVSKIYLGDLLKTKHMGAVAGYLS